MTFFFRAEFSWKNLLKYFNIYVRVTDFKIFQRNEDHVDNFKCVLLFLINLVIKKPEMIMNWRDSNN